MFKGALALIKEYDTDSSEDELVENNITIKRKLQEDESNKPKKRIKTRLPVPDIQMGSMELEDLSITQDCTIHNGRIRSFPHERGNWATFIYIPYEAPDSIEAISDILCNNLRQFNVQLVDHYHISLTKTVVLKHHWIEIFFNSVKGKISFIKSFITVFDNLNVYCNEEKTRTFIGLDIKSGYDTLLRLVQQLDMCLDEFQLPLYYDNPSFHLSLAWCNGDKESDIRNLLPHLQFCIEKEVSDYVDKNLYNYVTCINAKCGNKCFSFNLC